jgi:unsaturated pyranuronate lyase
MATLVGFCTFAALPEEQTSEKISRRGDQGMIVWWSVGAGVHVEPHSHANEQIVWMLKGKMEFRLGSEQRVCSRDDVVVIPGGTVKRVVIVRYPALAEQDEYIAGQLTRRAGEPLFPELKSLDFLMERRILAD